MTTSRTVRTLEKGEWKAIFLNELIESGNVSRAAKKAKVGRTFLYDQRKEDTDFAAAWDEAIEIAADAMEYEGWRRGTKGTLKPIFYKGAKVGTIREYSDTLLIFMLKATRPDKFREQTETKHTGAVQVNVRYE